jgi:hypothetical protein
MESLSCKFESIFIECRKNLIFLSKAQNTSFKSYDAILDVFEIQLNGLIRIVKKNDYFRILIILKSEWLEEKYNDILDWKLSKSSLTQSNVENSWLFRGKPDLGYQYFKFLPCIFHNSQK